MPNRRNAAKKIFLAAGIALLLLPISTAAQINTSLPANTGFATTLFGCTPATAGGTAVMCVLQRVLLFLLQIAFIIAIIFLIIGGFRYIISQGDEDAVAQARATIVNAIIGIILIVFAWYLMNFVLGLVQTGSA